MDINSELKDAQLEILDSDKAYDANKKGTTWFNRAENLVKVIYNSTVEVLTTKTYVDDEIDASEASLVATGLITAERSDPSTPASGFLHLFAKANALFFRNDSGTIEQVEVKSQQKVIDILTEEVNHFSEGFNGGTITVNIFTVPSGYSWTFVGTGYCQSGTDIPSNASSGYIAFDGKTTYCSNNNSLAGAGRSIPVGIVGSGTNTGVISILFGGSPYYRQIRGIATFYKKQ